MSNPDQKVTIHSATLAVRQVHFCFHHTQRHFQLGHWGFVWQHPLVRHYQCILLWKYPTFQATGHGWTGTKSARKKLWWLWGCRAWTPFWLGTFGRRCHFQTCNQEVEERQEDLQHSHPIKSWQSLQWWNPSKHHNHLSLSHRAERPGGGTWGCKKHLLQESRGPVCCLWRMWWMSQPHPPPPLWPLSPTVFHILRPGDMEANKKEIHVHDSVMFSPKLIYFICHLYFLPVYVRCSCRCLTWKQMLRTRGMSLWRTWQQQPHLQSQWLRRKMEWGISGSEEGSDFARHANMEMEGHTESCSSLTRERTATFMKLSSPQYYILHFNK